MKSLDMSHYSIEKIYMPVFIDGCIENKIEAFRDNEQQTNEELELIKLHILSQFYEAKNDDQTQYYIQLVSDLERLRLHITRVKAIVEAIKERPIPYLVELLKKDGYEEHGLTFSDETLKEDLQAVINIEAATINEYNMLMVEYREYEETREAERRKAGQKTGKANIYQSLNAIEEMQKTTYDIDKLTVYKYATLCKKYEAWVESQIPQHGR